MKALEVTAREGGPVYAAPIDGNSIADGDWLLYDKRLTSRFTGSQRLAAASRVHHARELRPTVRRLLHTTTRPYSDILGGLQRVTLLRSSGPLPRRLLVLTDGGIDVGSFNLYTEPPRTGRQRHRIIERLRRAGELPDLHGFDVYLVGVGLGYHNRTVARAAIALWHDLIGAMGGHLVGNDAGLRFP